MLPTLTPRILVTVEAKLDPVKVEKRSWRRKAGERVKGAFGAEIGKARVQPKLLQPRRRLLVPSFPFSRHQALREGSQHVFAENEVTPSTFRGKVSLNVVGRQREPLNRVTSATISERIASNYSPLLKRFDRAKLCKVRQIISDEVGP